MPACGGCVKFLHRCADRLQATVICPVRIRIVVETTNTLTDIPKEWVCENAVKDTCTYCKSLVQDLPHSYKTGIQQTSCRLNKLRPIMVVIRFEVLMAVGFRLRPSRL
jgi:hypothetical protein